MCITVIVKPNSKHREEVVQSDDYNFIVYTKAPAIEGKANKAVMLLLAKHFNVSKSAVNLLRGHNSKQKVFEINKD